MALLKTGTKYPLSVFASYSYQCGNEDCNYSITMMEEGEDQKESSIELNTPKCPKCGLKLNLISIHTDSKKPEELKDKND